MDTAELAYQVARFILMKFNYASHLYLVTTLISWAHILYQVLCQIIHTSHFILITSMWVFFLISHLDIWGNWLFKRQGSCLRSQCNLQNLDLNHWMLSKLFPSPAIFSAFKDSEMKISAKGLETLWVSMHACMAVPWLSPIWFHVSVVQRKLQ